MLVETRNMVLIKELLSPVSRSFAALIVYRFHFKRFFFRDFFFNMAGFIFPETRLIPFRFKCMMPIRLKQEQSARPVGNKLSYFQTDLMYSSKETGV